jgi:hypothetical protein
MTLVVPLDGEFLSYAFLALEAACLARMISSSWSFFCAGVRGFSTGFGPFSLMSSFALRSLSRWLFGFF